MDSDTLAYAWRKRAYRGTKFPSHEPCWWYLHRLRWPKKTGEKEGTRTKGKTRRSHGYEKGEIPVVQCFRVCWSPQVAPGALCESLCALFELSQALCFPVTRPGFLHARGIHLSVVSGFFFTNFLFRSFFLSFFLFYVMLQHVSRVALRKRASSVSSFFFSLTVVEKQVDMFFFARSPFPNVFIGFLSVQSEYRVFDH